ncbi:methionyl-tRNA formyltransferase [Oceanospirillum multiglobuliferum]|uniref:Methionyl-tRNA formyltransferase n=1 Tax=Oceanospirillum multiglobuliferum TaxID=64969 RepID=A0A1T4LVH9_9GAMM|nr:formyltransferase family protein [Oceanospirillum multiglobuliferum]OPX56345.1 hypothetical protein BTE48_05095 [Oceanospirillum multiglobuliferum]SJZ58733.1 methionyl-tRNA formyltransferase [Oceanospirillum multiglobuliferum]
MDALKITLLTSSRAALPLVALLAQRQQLAGVLLFGQWDQERVLLNQHLQQSGIPVQYCKPMDIDVPITAIKAWASELGLIFCCGDKIPMSVVQTPQYGMVNLHASALPDYRGADPIYWQIRNGEAQLQLTVHKVEEHFDAGDIITQRPVTIGAYDTQNHVFGRVLECLPNILDSLIDQLKLQDGLQGQPQAPISACTKSAARVTEKDLLINWRELSVVQLCNQVRAGNPQYGGARLVIGQGYAQLLQASPSPLPNHGVSPGSIIHVSPDQGMIVALKVGAVKLDIIANHDGVFDGYRFAQAYQLSAGMQFQ